MFQFFAKYMFEGDKRAYQFEADAVQLSKYVVLETECQKIYSDYQMMLILAPLGFCEEPAVSELAISLLDEQIKGLREKGAGIPRYDQHIRMMQELLDEFRAHHDFVKDFGRDPRRDQILGRENMSIEDAESRQ